MEKIQFIPTDVVFNGSVCFEVRKGKKSEWAFVATLLNGKTRMYDIAEPGKDIELTYVNPMTGDLKGKFEVRYYNV